MQGRDTDALAQVETVEVSGVEVEEVRCSRRGNQLKLSTHETVIGRSGAVSAN